MNLSTIGTVLLFNMTMYFIISNIMNFLGIGAEFYGSYMMWFFVIVMFWGFLPEQENYFSTK